MNKYSMVTLCFGGETKWKPEVQKVVQWIIVSFTRLDSVLHFLYFWLQGLRLGFNALLKNVNTSIHKPSQIWFAWRGEIDFLGRRGRRRGVCSLWSGVSASSNAEAAFQGSYKTVHIVLLSCCWFASYYLGGRPDSTLTGCHLSFHLANLVCGVCVLCVCVCVCVCVQTHCSHSEHEQIISSKQDVIVDSKTNLVLKVINEINFK